MLIHQSRWSNIRNTIDNVLLHEFNPDFSSEAVLDFLTACLFIPKLWRGREKHVPKHETLTDVLALTPDQLKHLIDYVLYEVESVDDEPEYQNILNKRMPLILRCLSNDVKANAVVAHLVNKEEIDDKVKELMLLIYMKIPKCLFYNELIMTKESSVNGKNYTSSMDSVSHTLMSALAATQYGRDWATTMQEFDAAARKLTSSHPLLILRNLPLLTSSLKGRTQFDFSFFRSQNHLKLYSITLGLLELLRPHIFRSEYRTCLHEALICYFEMTDVYEARKDSFSGLIDKFSLFLIEYVSFNPNVAVPFIREHGQNFPELSKALPQRINLKNLANSISWIRGENCNANLISSNSVEIKYRNEVGKFTHRFTKLMEDGGDTIGKNGELATILTDLLATSSGKPEILVPYFTEEIKENMCHPIKAVRSVAMNLFLRVLNYCPKKSPEMIPAYMNCLQSDDPSVIQAALEKLSDVCVLAQENLQNILQCVFSLGLYSNINVTPYVGETIALINSHAGY